MWVFGHGPSYLGGDILCSFVIPMIPDTCMLTPAREWPCPCWSSTEKEEAEAPFPGPGPAVALPSLVFHRKDSSPYPNGMTSALIPGRGIVAASSRTGTRKNDRSCDLVRGCVCTWAVACARAKRVRRIFCSYNVSTVKCLLIISEVVKSHGQISAVKSGQILGPNKKSTTRLWLFCCGRSAAVRVYITQSSLTRHHARLPPLQNI